MSELHQSKVMGSLILEHRGTNWKDRDNISVQ